MALLSKNKPKIFCAALTTRIPHAVGSSSGLHGPRNTTKDLGGGPRVVVSTAAFHARVRGSVPGLGGLKETKLFLPHPRVKVNIVGSLRDREVACSASDRQGSNFESCVWRTVSSQSSHHPQEVLLAQFSLYVHKGGLKPDSFHFITKDLSRFSSELLAKPSFSKSIIICLIYLGLSTKIFVSSAKAEILTCLLPYMGYWDNS